MIKKAIIRTTNYQRQPVDIIIPFHGQYESLVKCVFSIKQCTPNHLYRIILVDDASPNRHFLASFSKNSKLIVPVQLPEQRGFAGALYEGYKVSKANHLVFLHSDVELHNINWLLNLQRSWFKLKDKGVKLISARADNPGTANNYDERLFGLAINNLEEDIVVDKPLPLFCCLTHRELFSKIGGFIKYYPYAWFEDVELFFRMRHNRFYQAICVNSYCNHSGGATINEVIKNAEVRQIMENNENLCREDIAKYKLY